MQCTIKNVDARGRPWTEGSARTGNGTATATGTGHCTLGDSRDWRRQRRDAYKADDDHEGKKCLQALIKRSIWGSRVPRSPDAPGPCALYALGALCRPQSAIQWTWRRGGDCVGEGRKVMRLISGSLTQFKAMPMPMQRQSQKQLAVILALKCFLRFFLCFSVEVQWQRIWIGIEVEVEILKLKQWLCSRKGDKVQGLQLLLTCLISFFFCLQFCKGSG